jgi:electron transfer flavoprotein alpha subunit
LEVLTCGRKLADDLGGQVHAVVIGDNSSTMAETLARYGADGVYLINSPLLQNYHAEIYVKVLAELFERENPDIVVYGATPTGRDLATRLAARFRTGLISECVSLALDQAGALSGNKLTHGGRINSTVVCLPSKPQMASLKAGVVTIGKPDIKRKPLLTVIKPELDQNEYRTHLKGIVKADPARISLDEADIIVAGGRGLAGRENLQLLEEVAKLLGGVVAASLGAIDEGWLPHNKLVGQTGATVNPKLYVACGISGSVYHVLGMRDSEFVVAINIDPNAPIFKVSDMSIVGDLSEVMSAIIDLLRELTKDKIASNGLYK